MSGRRSRIGARGAGDLPGSSLRIAAVLAFCDYWSDRDRIVGQLQQAQIRLLTAPAEKHPPHGPFKHGG